MPTHLAEAARSRPAAEGHPLVERLVRLVTNEEFQATCRLTAKDVALLQANLDRALRAAAADLHPAALLLVAEAAFALVAFRRRELRPEPIFRLAGEGKVAAAASRFGLFEADERWRQAVLLVLAWLGATISPDQARQILDGLPPPQDGTLHRLARHVEAALGGPEVTRAALRAAQASDFDLAKALVSRVEGQGVNVELLHQYGHTASLQDTEGLTQAGYLAEEDGPVLVSFAAAYPTEGSDFLDRYLSTLEGYSYTEYRNQSLWFLLAEAVKHPEPDWIRTYAVRMATSALSPAGAEFHEGVGITLRALRARAGDAGAGRALQSKAQEIYALAASFYPSPDSSRSSDTYGSVKRRLAALAQCFASVLDQPGEAQKYIDVALAIAESGFAGFQMPACLTLAESCEVSVPQAPQLAQDALEFARTAAHSVQDATFCARSTARYNAMRRLWWSQLPGDLPGAVRRLAENAAGPEFAAAHIVGEVYSGRRGGGLPPPEHGGTVRTLAGLAELYHRPLADFLRLNQAFGWQAGTLLELGAEVRVPERGLAPLIAGRLSAAVLADLGLGQPAQVELIQLLVPVAAANPTTLDTVLARLLLAAQPADEHGLQALTQAFDGPDE